METTRFHSVPIRSGIIYFQEDQALNKSKVAIVKGSAKPSAKEIEVIVRQAVGLVGGLDDIKKGDVVLIKPNICSAAKPGSAVFTNPFVAKAVADLVIEKGGRAIIGEASGVADITEECIQADGYGDLRKAGYEVIDLKGKDIVYRKIPVPRGKALKELNIPEIVLNAKLIVSVPVMKTHALGATLAIKNMKGVLPDNLKKKFHTVYGVTQSVIDMMTTAVKPGLAVVDGILAMEGMGPMIGTPVELGVIIAGKDVVSVDAVAAAVMGFEPEEIGIIDGAGKAGIGISDLKKIEILGTPLQEAKRRFKRCNEAMQETLPFPEGFKLVIEEKACTGCRESVLSAMLELNKENKLNLYKAWTVIAGQTKSLPECDKSKLLIVGTCNSKHKNQGIFVEACPPWPWQVINGFTGEKLDPWNLNRF
jgi:uncharacterized protein (DUF362 family)